MAAVSCRPLDLAELAACYCYDAITKEKVKIYLLAVAAGLQNSTPAALAAAARCYCYDAQTMKKVQAYLLCQVANAEGVGSNEAGGEGGNVIGAE